MRPVLHALSAVVLAACFVKPERAAVATDGPGDADTGCVEAACQARGGTCVAGDVCEIDATSATTSVMCPSDMKCRVLCGADECKDGILCADATECDVRCVGDAACANGGVDCQFANVCLVHCVGSNACQHGPGPADAIHCRAATCTVTCDGASACQDGIDTDLTGCTSHCCNGACQGGTACANADMTCT
jgi:hypothetical protein